MTLIHQLGVLAERGISVTMKSRSVFEIGGFYKSGTVDVNIDEGVVTARYNEETNIRDNDLIQTLIDVNYDWWQRSINRFDGWKQPDSNWTPLLKEYGMVTPKTVEIYS